MPSDAQEEERDVVEPTDLVHVGEATAPLIEAAPFDAAAIASRRVSYVMLLEAGVNPGVAARIRREYSLVWSFDWEWGADLSRRAALVSGLSPEQAEWIAASTADPPAAAASGPAAGDGSGALLDAARAWAERRSVPELDVGPDRVDRERDVPDGARSASSPATEAETAPDAEEPPDGEAAESDGAEPGASDPGSACPRCGGDLTRYTFGDSDAVQCSACGYVGVAPPRDSRSGDGESWDEAIDRFRDPD